MNDLSLVSDTNQNSTFLLVQLMEPIRFLITDLFNRFDTTGIFLFSLILISIHLIRIWITNSSGI